MHESRKTMRPMLAVAVALAFLGGVAGCAPFDVRMPHPAPAGVVSNTWSVDAAARDCERYGCEH